MKRFLIIAMMISIGIVGVSQGYEYLLTGNNQGSYYTTGDHHMPDSRDVSMYHYDTTLGGLDLFPPVSTQDELEDGLFPTREADMIDGFGSSGAGDVFGPWDGNKRIDVVFDLGGVYDVAKAELRTHHGRVSTFTVWTHVSDDTIGEDPNSMGWQLLGVNDSIEGAGVANYVQQVIGLENPSDPNSDVLLDSQYGRYVWFEIQGDDHQVQVSELAVWGDLLDVAPVDCADAWASGRGDAADINKDCFVDLLDFSLLAHNWLKCNNPGDAGCDVVVFEQ